MSRLRSPLAVAAASSLLVIGVAFYLARQTQSQTFSMGFWFEEDACVLPNHAAARVGGQLTETERELVRRLSRAELDRAFAGLRVAIGQERNALWRVAVHRNLPRRGPLPRSGESMASFFGGFGQIDCEFVASEAILHAPPAASRRMIIEGIARGVGATAAHEFGHQLVDMKHDDQDVDSYEYPSPDRASQYYGELHWSTARTPLQLKLGLP